MKKVFTTKNLVLMAMFSALAAVLMLWEFPIPFIAPNFYEIDLSEIPVAFRILNQSTIITLLSSLIQTLLSVMDSHHIMPLAR